MRKLAKSLAFLLSLVMLISVFTACGNPDKGEESSGKDNEVAEAPPADTNDEGDRDATVQPPEPIELNFFLFGDEGNHYRNVEEVLTEFEERTKDILNTKINITFTPPQDHRENLPLWIASGDDMDLVFDAPWQNLIKLAGDGAYADLEEYFNNPEYPGLMKAFAPEYLDSNRLFDKIYAIPMTNTFMDMEGIVYRKDILDKHDLDPIASYDDLYNFLSIIADKEDEMTPYGPYGNRAFFKLFLQPSKRQLEGKVFTFLDYIDVAISADGKSVAGVATYGDTDEAYEGFDPKWGKDYILEVHKNYKKFTDFLPPNVMSEPDLSGKPAAAWYGVISGFQNQVNQHKVEIPEAELAFWPIYENSQNMTPGGQATDYKAWNFACIPAYSEKIGRTMKFLDWLYGDRDNNDLFQFGIEGVHWTAVGENEWKIKDGVDPNTNYAFPAYQMGWSPIYQRMPAGLPDEVQAYMNYQFDQSTFTETAIAGFTFNEEPVKTEIAMCAPVVDKYVPPLMCGLFDDAEEELKKFGDELRAAGVDKIKDELEKQLNDFLANK